MLAPQAQSTRGFGLRDALLSLALLITGIYADDTIKQDAVNWQVQKLHTGVPVALPTGVYNGVNYDAISTLANLSPIIQANAISPIADAPAPASDSAQKASTIKRSKLGEKNTYVRRDGPLRIMIAGDSMSQGKEGDYTWRYRLWEWLNSQNVNFELVGPYTGTRNQPDAADPVPPPLYGEKTPQGPVLATGGYSTDVNPGFSGKHYSVWGRACAQDIGEVQGVVQNNQPDVLLIMLGFNDLGWFYSNDKGLIYNMHQFIKNARAANPNIRIALANVPQRTSLGREDLPRLTDSYNQMLEDNIPYWSTDASPIHIVHLRQNYKCELDGCPAGYDGLHPNAGGEYQIAQAFSQTLSQNMNIGNTPLVIPDNIPSRSGQVPSNFQVATSPQGVSATWDKVYGAYGYNVRSRLSGFDWQSGRVEVPRFDIQWAVEGATYEIQVQTSCGDGCNADWTSVQSAVAHPQTPFVPTNTHVTTSGTSIQVSFDPPTGPRTGSIVEYNLITWDLDTCGSWISGAAFKSSPATVTDMVAGHRYLVALTAWNEHGEGFPAVLNNVIVGGGTPGTPGNVAVAAVDAGTAHITWDPVDGAAGYNIWSRNVNDGSVSTMANISTPVPCSHNSFLFPGVHNYEFCVSAFNGDNYGSKSACVLAPEYKDGSSAPAACPAAPVHQMTGCGGDGGFKIPTFPDPPNDPPDNPNPSQDPPSSTSPLPGHGVSQTPTPKPPTSHCDTRYGTQHWQGAFWDPGRCKPKTDYSGCYPDEATATRLLWDQYDAAFEKLCLGNSCDGSFAIKFPGDGCSSKKVGPNLAYNMAITAEYPYGKRDDVKVGYTNLLHNLTMVSYNCKTEGTSGVNTITITTPTSMNVVSDDSSDSNTNGKRGLGYFMTITLSKPTGSNCEVVKQIWGLLGGQIAGGPVFGAILAGTCK